MQTEMPPSAEATVKLLEHRRRLIQAMGACAAARGFAATTIGDVVREAGVSKRTFYEHFAGKQACFLAMYRTVSAASLRSLSDSMRPDLPWADQLEHAVRAYFARLGASPTLLRTLFVEVQHLGDEGASARREVMVQLAEFMRVTVNRGQADGAGAALSPALAMAAVGAINELVLQAIERGEADRLEDLTQPACDIVRALARFVPGR